MCGSILPHDAYCQNSVTPNFFIVLNNDLEQSDGTFCSLLTIAHVITAVAGSDSSEAGASTSAENTTAFERVILSWNTFILISY